MWPMRVAHVGVVSALAAAFGGGGGVEGAMMKAGPTLGLDDDLPAPGTTTHLGFERHLFRYTGDGHHSLHLTSAEAAAEAKVPTVAVTHLLKAGGSRLMHLIGQVLSMDAGYVRQTYFGHHFAAPNQSRKTSYVEQMPFVGAKTPRTSYFTIGMVRNPCSYLVSMWSFQSENHGIGHAIWPKKCLMRKYEEDEVEEMYRLPDMPGIEPSRERDEENVRRFRRWLYATGGKHIHYLTYRSFLALHTGQIKVNGAPDQPDWDDGQLTHCLNNVTEAEEMVVIQTMKEVDMHAHYDCLIHTENLEDEVRSCLMTYANQLNSYPARVRVKKAIKAVSWEKDKIHAGVHKACKKYYDNETAQYVWEREGVFAKRVGYHQCCAAREGM